MASEKLTYPQIVNLAIQGKYDEIPEGYKIKWVGNQEPKTLYDYTIPKEGVTLTGPNRPPFPDEVKIKGEIQIQPYYGDEEEEPLEYGEVILMTCFSLSELKFIYRAETCDIPAVMEYLRRNAETVTGRFVPKKDLVFDAQFRVENVLFSLHAMMNVRATFLPETEDCKEVVLEFVYDYMSQEILEEK